MSARLVLIACFVATVGTAPALAGEVLADGALPFSSRPYAKLFAPPRQLPSLTQAASASASVPEVTTDKVSPIARG